MEKLNWGLIGGGDGSQIGLTHRIAAELDGCWRLRSGAFDVDSERSLSFGHSLGLESGRVYGDWRQMLARESERSEDRLQMVTVATPNATHYEITKAWLEAGFDVLCEKPLTMELEQARDLVAYVRAQQRICAVNYGYSGYPLVRQARAMVAAGELGAIRLVIAEFAHGHHADASDADNPRIRWRYDPKQAGASSVFADCGIHALHLACFICGQQPRQLNADFRSCVAGRELEDDALINAELSSGATLRLWSSAVACGRQHGLGVQVFGSKGGLSWRQEAPNQLQWAKLGAPTQVIERANSGVLTPAALRASRIAVGHPEGFIGAVGNIYRDLGEVISARKRGDQPNPEALSYPSVEDGAIGVAAIEAAVRSAATGSRWQQLDSWEAATDL